MFEVTKNKFMEKNENENKTKFANLESLDRKTSRGMIFMDTLVFGGIIRRDENKDTLKSKIG